MGVTVMPDCYRGSGVVHVALEGFGHRRALGFLIADEALADHPLLTAIDHALRPPTTSDAAPGATPDGP